MRRTEAEDAGLVDMTGRLRRYAMVGVGAALSVTMLSACGGGRDTINWLVPADSTEAVQRVATACEQSARGAYKINIQELPTTAEGQRGVIVRPLRARSSVIDVAAVDPRGMARALHREPEE